MEEKNKSKEKLAKELDELRQVVHTMELERQELEKTLGERFARYRAVVEDQTELICRFAPDTTLTFVNEAYCRFFNKRSEDLLGFSFMPLIPPTDRKKVKAQFDSLGPKNPVATHEHQVMGKNGEIRWQQWTNRAICDKQGVIKEFQSVGRDITNRKLAEEALCRARDDMEQKVEERTRELVEANEQLKREIKGRKREKSRRRESEEKYRRLIESSIDGIAIVQGTEIKFANQALLDMYGASSAEEVIGQNFTKFVAHKDRDLLLQRGLHRERGDDVPNRYEFKALRQDGTDFDVEISVNPISYLGKAARQAVLRDVTARKRGERYLRTSEQNYRLLVENLPSVVYKGYKDWSVDFVDEKIEALTGYSMKGFNSRRMKWSDLIVEEDLAGARESFIKALKGDKSYVREYRIKTKDEDILWIQERAMIVCDQKGEIDYVSGVFFDITEQKRAQEALSKSQAELSEKSRHLEEVNAALSVLLKRREEDKHDLQENILANVKELVLPYVEKLKNSNLHSEQTTLVSILESNMKEIFSPFVTKLSSRLLSLTPTEIKIASLIKDGKSSKEIASLLHASENTIRSHRFHIRSKLQLKNKKVNLRSYLRSMQN